MCIKADINEIENRIHKCKNGFFDTFIQMIAKLPAKLTKTKNKGHKLSIS